MATTTYFEQELLATDKSSNADPSQPKSTLEIQVSSFSGEHQLYLAHEDGEGNQSYSVIGKKQAQELLEGLETAMHYLKYVD